MPITGLDPTGGASARVEERTLAARPTDLTGQRLGLVVNGLGRSEELFDALTVELGTLVDFADVVKVVKASVSIPPDPGDWSRVTEGATVAITGFGG